MERAPLLEMLRPRVRGLIAGYRGKLAATLPDPNLSSALNGNVLAAINQLSGGVRFGDIVTVSVEAVARTDKDAQALADVLKFAASLVRAHPHHPLGSRTMRRQRGR